MMTTTWLFIGILVHTVFSEPTFSADNISAAIQDLQDKLQNLETENEMLKKQVFEMKNERHSTGKNNAIAFHAYITEDHTVESEAKIMFAGVFLNQGSSFNPDTSQFTCPVDGIYSFSFNLFSGADYWTAQLTVDRNDETTIGFSSVYLNNAHTHGSSATAVISCNQGEKVFVRNTFTTSKWARSVEGSAGQEDVWQSNFSGFLIEQTF